LKRIIDKYGFLLAVAGVVYFLDQLTKILVRANLPLGDMWSPWSWLMPYARIIHISNMGAAFGMLPGLRDIFTILAFLVAIAILYYFPQVPRSDWTLRLAMGLQFGGALGNLTDRLHQGYVTDFLSVGNFPVLNVADASISIGVAVLVLSMWFKGKENTPSGTPAPVDPASEAVSGPVREDYRGE